MGDLNYYQASTSPEKGRGKYYTPPDLVRLILEALESTAEDCILDPSCGDGEFLVGAVRLLASRFAGRPRELGRKLAGRLNGFDIHAEATATARERVAATIRECCGFTVPPEALPLRCLSALEYPERPATLPDGRLLIVGNPPYVEAKRLPGEVKAELRARYPDALSGAPDLYLYFLHVCLGWLRDRDRLALVLPNKSLVNANARRVRERLVDEECLLRIDFATQAGVFEDAAVYPVVLYAGGPGAGAARLVSLARIDRSADGLDTAAIPPIDACLYRGMASLPFFPSAAHPVLQEALCSMLQRGREGRLGDVLDIRWTVSFHRKGLREQFVTPARPPSKRARRFLGGGPFSGNGEVTRFGIRWGGWWIDYDSGRLSGEGNSLPDPAIFGPPKIVICQNGRTLRAAYDADGFVLKDTFLCGLPVGEHPLAAHPRALVGLLCSRAIHFFYSHVFHGGHVSGGYLHFLRTFLADVPLGTWTVSGALSLAGLVEQAATARDLERRWLEEEMEERVEAAFGLSPDQRAALAVWAAGDSNWLGRDRVRWRENPGRTG